MNSEVNAVVMDNSFDTASKVDAKRNFTFYLCFKRFIDIIFSFVGLVLLIPIAIIIKIAYILTGDFHRIIFSQNRIGLNGKEFKMFKFRTMVPNADDILKELLTNDATLREEYIVNKKLKNDPRITKAGRIIRKLSLDELPQLINVFKGDMSLVGNRPYLVREKVDMYPEYDDIVSSKPGITGIWQVSGRSNTTFKTRCKLEADYSKNISLSEDFKILIKTIKVVFKGL